jgi:hypothetical protein
MPLRLADATFMVAVRALRKIACFHQPSTAVPQKDPYEALAKLSHPAAPDHEGWRIVFVCACFLGDLRRSACC